ncbi:hypothetical protein [Virgibacillus dokdonensis]|uniref:hypothetical protein n=1 Tax=Virgibacillus dokdonensis TaxID=302167 RepID=UPI0015F24E2D|nr:hypothetical protein [Virgibacillus dokdonensis]
MIDVFLDVMLGPFRSFSKFYYKHQFIFNAGVIGFAVYNLFFGSKKRIHRN